MINTDTVLITGGAGFIGRYLTRDILQVGMRVVIFDNFMAKSFFYRDLYGQEPARISIRGDVRDYSLLKEVFLRYQPGMVIHLAAISDANMALQAPQECLSINVDGLNNLFTVISQATEVRRFIFVSSSYVYGNFHYEPADELHPLDSRHIYGITKIRGEQITADFCVKNNIDYTIIRPTAVYGLGSSLERICCRMIIDALTKKEIVVHNHGNQKLDFTQIDDLTQGFLKVLSNNNAKNQVFNLSRGKSRSIAELAGLIAKNIPGVKIINRNAEFEKPLRGALDISKARDMLGFSPLIDIEEGIPVLINDLIRIKDKYDLSIPAVY
ncbi:MAG: NAD(P)-dependent oxidoreductase [Candidatus Omnitrophota bacterium]